MPGFLRRSLIAAEMQARQLLRRRLSLIILVALPVALYLSTLTNGSESAIQFGALGMGWSVASAALFSVLAARSVEPRLVLAGYRAAELMVGRFILLLGMGAVLAGIGAVAMTLVSAPVSEGALLASCALVPVVAVALGLAVGAVLPHDLEGVLVIIGVVGVQLSLKSERLGQRAAPSRRPDPARLPRRRAERRPDRADAAPRRDLDGRAAHPRGGGVGPQGPGDPASTVTAGCRRRRPRPPRAHHPDADPVVASRAGAGPQRLRHARSRSRAAAPLSHPAPRLSRRRPARVPRRWSAPASPGRR